MLANMITIKIRNKIISLIIVIILMVIMTIMMINFSLYNQM